MPFFKEPLFKEVPPAHPKKFFEEAHPEHRAARKQLEKEHPGFGWKKTALLGMMGVMLLMNIEKDVKKHEEKHEREEEREKKKNGGGSRDRDRDRDGGRDRGGGRDRDSGRDRDGGRDRNRDRDRGGYQQPRVRSSQPDRRRLRSPPPSGRPRSFVDNGYYDARGKSARDSFYEQTSWPRELRRTNSQASW